MLMERSSTTDIWEYLGNTCVRLCWRIEWTVAKSVDIQNCMEQNRTSLSSIQRHFYTARAKPMHTKEHVLGAYRRFHISR